MIHQKEENLMAELLRWDSKALHSQTSSLAFPSTKGKGKANWNYPLRFPTWMILVIWKADQISVRTRAFSHISFMWHNGDSLWTDAKPYNSRDEHQTLMKICLPFPWRQQHDHTWLTEYPSANKSSSTCESSRRGTTEATQRPAAKPQYILFWILPYKQKHYNPSIITARIGWGEEREKRRERERLGHLGAYLSVSIFSITN